MEIQTYDTQSSTFNSEFFEIPIADKFRLNAKKKLGSGAFGEIYYGFDIEKNQSVAIKLEPKSTKHPLLHLESKLYIALRGGIGIPTLHWSGTQGNYNILIVELLGPSLEDCFTFCQRKFSIKTTMLIAEQMISRIEFVHSKHYIHRDIKPDNFLIGLGKHEKLIYIIDFGLAKKYIDPNGNHIPFKEGKSLTGTARYTSINTHLGIEQSRRDDLEAIGYVLVYFLRGELPWQGLKAKNLKEKYEKIKEKKIKTPIDELCKGFPKELQDFIQETRGLTFDDRPDYQKFRNFIIAIKEKERIVFDSVYDWNKLQEEKRKEKMQKEEKKKKES